MTFDPFNGFDPFGGGAAAFSPLSLSPSLWLSDAGTDPSVWPDLSGNGRDATQGTAANQPSIVPAALNGRQVRRLDGTNDGMICPQIITGAVDHSVFAVVKLAAANAAATRCICGQYQVGQTGRYLTLMVYDNGATDDWACGYEGAFGNRGGAATTAATILNAERAGSVFTLRRNGTVDGATNTTSGNILATAFRIGFGLAADTSGIFHTAMDIAEVIAFPAALSTPNRQAVTQYLGAKYGISVA